MDGGQIYFTLYLEKLPFDQAGKVFDNPESKTRPATDIPPVPADERATHSQALIAPLPRQITTVLKDVIGLVDWPIISIGSQRRCLKHVNGSQAIGS